MMHRQKVSVVTVLSGTREGFENNMALVYGITVTLSRKRCLHRNGNVRIQVAALL